MQANNITGTFTIADGSSFSGTFSITGAALPVLTFSGPISSGTGIFEHASGSLQATLTATVAQNSTILTYTITGSGTVTTEDAGVGLTVTPGGLTFQVAQGIASPALQGVVIHNAGLNPASFQAKPSTISGENWLFVSPSNGTVAAFSNVPLTVTAEGPGLAAGVYQGQVKVTSDAASVTVIVELVVGPAGTYLQLSQTGLYFQGHPGGSPPLAQTISVSNTGVGTLQGLKATPSVLDQGPSWLNATVVSSAAGQVQVAVAPNLKGLTVGKHFGQVAFSLPGSPNSPQVATIGVDVSKDQVGFIADALNVFIMFDPEFLTGQSPQFGVANNYGNVAGTFTTQVEGAPWLSVSPASGALPVGSPPTKLTFSTVPSAVAGLAPGEYNGDVRVRFTPNPATGDSIIPATLIVPSSNPVQYSNGDSGFPAAQPASATCAPTQMLVFTTLKKSFQVTAGRPVPIQAFVNDNCAQQVDSGTVVATFSSGDPAVPLTSIGSGQWSATWVPQKVADDVKVTVQAQTVNAPILSATRFRNGSVAAADSDTPIVNHGGVGSAANGVTTIAPGEFITIYGSNLKTGAAAAPSSAPYPPALDGVQVTLGGRVLPLAYSGAGQINAIVPYDIPPNTRQQLVVETATAFSQPEMVTIATAQPGVFTQNQSGTGPGAIMVQKKGSNVSTLITASNPASAGDALLIFSTGLGTVTPPVDAGAATPAATLSHSDNPAAVTVGGKPAAVLFAGLAPGFVGLYQVNVTVPTGIAPAADVPVVMTVAGAESVPVTVAIK